MKVGNLTETKNHNTELESVSQPNNPLTQKKMVALIILIIALQSDVSTSCNDSLRWRHQGIFPSQLRSHLFPVAMAK